MYSLLNFGVKMSDSVYEDLVIDIVTHCNMNMFQARKVVNYLRGEGILDYDILKEYYFEGEISD
jgi:predicted transcriptional regulator